MAVTIQIEKGKFCDPVQFFNALTLTIDRSIDKAVTKYTKRIREEWRSRSDRSGVPGSFSDTWKNFKASKGLKTTDFQRFGRGDSRSMYENIKIKKFNSGRGWFVGIPIGTPAYDWEGNRVETSLDKVAGHLEKDLNHPLWEELWQQSPPILLSILREELVKQFRQLGAGDAA